MNKELADYLRSKEGLNRLMKYLRDKYISLNRYSGSIILNNINEQEVVSLNDLLGKTYKKGDNIKISFKEITKKINDTKYCNFEWGELFKYYFNEKIISKKNLKVLDSSSYLQFLNEIIKENCNNKYINKLKMITNSECILFGYLKKLFNKDKKGLKNNLNNIFLLLNNLPDNPLNLTLFASITGNPHYLDLDTNTFNIFIRFLCFIFDQKIPSSNDEKIELLSFYNIYVDYFSNFVITYNLSGCEILDKFKESKQIFNINLSNVFHMNNIDTKKKVVYIFENPSLLNILKELDVPIIITSGMPNMTLYKILDKLTSNNNKLYYNGDFDPEGLIIAEKLKRRYQSLVLICYNEDSYMSCKSKEIINEQRLKKLDGIGEAELNEIKNVLKKYKYSGYQENNIENIKKYIIDKICC